MGRIIIHIHYRDIQFLNLHIIYTYFIDTYCWRTGTSRDIHYRDIQFENINIHIHYRDIQLASINIFVEQTQKGV